MRWLALLLPILLSACWSDENLPPEAKVCAANLYSNFNPRSHEQCMNICKKCQNGNTLTCSTACQLKGATDRP
jgi:hypothetical protein